MKGFREFDRYIVTIVDAVRWLASRFNEASLYFGHGTDNAVDEALVLVRFALHLPHDVPDRLYEGRLTRPEKRRIYELATKRISERVPLPYLTGEAWFAGMRFHVTRDVIIPRSPVAELVEQEFRPWVEPALVRDVADLCTGSGCIAVACAEVFPDARVDAVDVSSPALAIARENIQRHGVADRVHLYQSDLFEALSGRRYDLIVTNPPYVDGGDLDSMPSEFRHEPRLALEAGEDGLDVAARILRRAGEHLKADGVLVMEVGNSAPALEARFPGVPFTWLEFERGGVGVLVLDAHQLREYADEFRRGGEGG